MPAWLNRIATPLTTGLFIVSLVSGVALFFHVGMGTFHGMHEWLSMVLIPPFLLHIWRNWRPFVGYFRRAVMPIALVLCVLAAIPFAMPQSEGSAPGNPLVAIAGVIEAAPASSVAELYGYAPADFILEMNRLGWNISSEDLTMKAVAVENGKDTRALLSALAKLPSQ